MPCSLAAGLSERGVTAALGAQLDGPQVGVGFVTGLVDDEVCRCEFQVRRKRSRAFSIGTRSQARNRGRGQRGAGVKGGQGREGGGREPLRSQRSPD
jgi:hypothetical protein